MLLVKGHYRVIRPQAAPVRCDRGCLETQCIDRESQKQPCFRDMGHTSHTLVLCANVYVLLLQNYMLFKVWHVWIRYNQHEYMSYTLDTTFNPPFWFGSG